MNYFLDSNTCIYFLKGKYPSIKKRWLEIPPNKIKIPAIVKAELLAGAYKSQNPKDTIKKVEKLLKPYEIFPFSDEITHTYADIRAKLEKVGEPIGPNDILIASIVLYHKGTLITHNTKEFKRIKNLKVEDWVNG